MGIVTNLVACDCLRKDNIELTDVNPNNKNISEDEEKIPVSNIEINQNSEPGYFEGKIDVKDYIQMADTDSLDNYKKLELIGKGSYGSVYKVIKKNTDLVRAMKIIPKHYQKDNSEILREIEILKNLDHPNVMKIYEFLEDDDNYYIIEEFCEQGDLETILNGGKIFSEFLVKFIMYQVFLAINYLHQNNIVHQDIKKKNITIFNLEEKNKDKNKNMEKIDESSENIVRHNSQEFEYNNPISINNDDIFIKINNDKEVQKEFLIVKNIQKLTKKGQGYLSELSKKEIKVIDFGEAIFMPQKKKYINDISGTLLYLSPELIRGQMVKELDEWACGVLMYYLLSGHPPFDGKTEDEICNNIENQILDLNTEEFKDITDDCKDLISKLLERDISKRIKVEKALGHKFFTDNGIDIKKLVVGMESKNKEVLNKWIRYQKTHRESNTGVFKKAVIAYMALNFVEKEEEKKIKNLFHKLSNGNKKFLINKQNFKKTINEVTNSYTDQEIDVLFDKLDDNKSGIIEYEELVRGFSDREKLLNEKNMKEAFNFFDKDKNGTINWEEISKVVFQNQKTSKTFLKQFLEEIDQDSTNVNISFEDFCKIIKSK